MKLGLASRREVLRDFDDQEEFYAIMVENYFRSGLRWPLRANHHGYDELRVTSLNSAGDWCSDREYVRLLQTYGYLLERFEFQMQPMAELLANLDDIRYRYNPIRHIRELAFGTCQPHAARGFHVRSRSSRPAPPRQINGAPPGRTPAAVR